MSKKKALTLITGFLMALGVFEPVLAQGFGAPPFGVSQDRYSDRSVEEPYRRGFQQGYRSGYDDGRSLRAYDDSDYNYGYSYDYSRRDDSREQRWRQRYSRTYTYNDDLFYQDCRQTVDPAGVIVGARIGGILGNAGRGRSGGPTVAGVIAGGALGAALTRDLNCEDRSYAYKTYYDGFNAGRPNARHQWRNPRSGHYGEFLVRDFYNDPDGFRCANYIQQIFISGGPTQQFFVSGGPRAASGRACQQPDGTWAIVG